MTDLFEPFGVTFFVSCAPGLHVTWQDCYCVRRWSNCWKNNIIMLGEEAWVNYLMRAFWTAFLTVCGKISIAIWDLDCWIRFECPLTQGAGALAVGIMAFVAYAVLQIRRENEIAEKEE